MKLNLKERFTIVSLLPEKGNFEKILIKKDLLNKIDISQEDVKDFNIRQLENGQIAWETKENGDSKEFELTELENKYLKGILEDINKKEELPETLFEVYKVLFNK